MFNFFIFKLMKFLFSFVDSIIKFHRLSSPVLNIKIEKMKRLFLWEKALFEFKTNISRNKSIHK